MVFEYHNMLLARTESLLLTFGEHHSIPCLDLSVKYWYNFIDLFNNTCVSETVLDMFETTGWQSVPHWHWSCMSRTPNPNTQNMMLKQKVNNFNIHTKKPTGHTKVPGWIEQRWPVDNLPYNQRFRGLLGSRAMMKFWGRLREPHI